MHKKKENREYKLYCAGSTAAPLKILFMHNTLPEYRIEWFGQMQKLADIDYVFTNESENYRKYKTNIEKDRLLKSRFLAPGITGFIELIIILTSIQYNVIELPPVDTFHEYLMAKLTVVMTRKNNVKLVYFWEKWEAPKYKQPLRRKIKNWILGTAAKNIYKNVDAIFAGSTSCKDYFENHGIKESKITIIPDCSMVPDCKYINIRNKYGIDSSKFLLLYFGRLMPEKGLSYLIKALSRLNNAEDYHLLVAGEGSSRKIFEKLARTLGVSNITFAGLINPKERKNYFEQCDVFIFPGTWMGGWVDVWGLTNNEAIQFGKPIISTCAVGSAIDLIRDGVNGYIIEPENVIELCNAIIKSKTELSTSKVRSYDMIISNQYSAVNASKEYISKIYSIFKN